MGRKQKISEFRERLDKTLASYDLSNEDSIKTLVRNQLIRSSLSENEGDIGKIVEKRTIDVSNFLDMLRSASVSDGDVSKSFENPHGDWKVGPIDWWVQLHVHIGDLCQKLKQDNEEYRVMYREGPQGSPFHTLLVEGYIDAPVDVCLCVSWETTLYEKWWPQFHLPTFKIISSTCLQKVRIGEQISLVRLKVSWPLSNREAVLHYYELEYLKDGLVIVLLNTVSDLKSIDRSIHGFTSDGIPEEKDVVRIDIVGGFAIQKVTSDRSYFRTIANMDIKLDFIPPSFINFIARQLIGNGFKLYQKAVASVAKGDEDFVNALKGPLYARIREGMDPDSQLKKSLELEDFKNEKFTFNATNEHPNKTIQADAEVIDQTSLHDDHAIEATQADTMYVGQSQTSLAEIEEVDIEQEIHLDEKTEGMDNSSIHQIASHASMERMVIISPEVENALTVLDEAISIVQRGGFSAQTFSHFRLSKQEFQNLEKVAGVGSSALEDGQVLSDGEASVEIPKAENVDLSSDKFGNGSVPSSVPNSRFTELDSSSTDLNQNHTAEPAYSPEQNLPISIKTQPVALHSSHNGTTMETPVPDNITKDHKQGNAEENGFYRSSFNDEKKELIQQKKKQRLCCLRFFPGHV